MMAQQAAERRPTAEEAGLDRAKQLQGELVKSYYRWVWNVRNNGGKIAYCFVMANPAELLRVFDIAPVYPEITSLQISYRGGAPQLINLSEEFGYSTDCCGYVKMGVATVLNKGQTAIGNIPTPDMAMLTYSGCQIYIHWWEQYQYLTKTPVFTIDIPYVRDYNGHVDKHDIKYVAAQLEEIIPALERFTGKRFDEEKLREYVRLSAEAWELWKRCLHMGKLKPSPIDAYFEAIYYMSAITLIRGTEECVDFYRFLLQELQERHEKGIGPTPDEKFRLVFEGVPNYPFFKRFWNLFRQWNARCVAATYPKVAGMVDVDAFTMNPEKPLESIAEYMIHAYCNWNMLMRTNLIKKYVNEYSADGVVIHSIKSCRSFSMGHGDIREYLIKELDVPALHIESDHVDPRYYAEAQLKNRVDAFFESLSVRKGV
jgi:benzoyl-CoA reductase subunit B